MRKKLFIQTDTFLVRPRKLRIFRVIVPGTAIILWTSEKLGIRYVQRLHIRRLMRRKKIK
ncbi:MAG: hypothetical protein EOM37_01245 [Proteobacteria bacterium]|jgi:hypothetical protein|nr:hypothetical protein [Pseudomonadota bacterium]